MSDSSVVPTIETPRTILRAFNGDEAGALQAILAEPGVLRYFPSSTPPEVERVARIIASQWKHWDERGYGWWAVEEKNTGKLMGWSGLGYLDESDETEIKYLFGRSFWGQGFATESSLVGIEYAFNQTVVETVIGLTHLENFASQRVLKKLGLSFRNQAEYFGMQCRRFTITREEYVALGRPGLHGV